MPEGDCISFHARDVQGDASGALHSVQSFRGARRCLGGTALDAPIELCTGRLSGAAFPALLEHAWGRAGVASQPAGCTKQTHVLDKPAHRGLFLGGRRRPRPAPTGWDLCIGGCPGGRKGEQALGAHWKRR